MGQGRRDLFRVGWHRDDSEKVYIGLGGKTKDLNMSRDTKSETVNTKEFVLFCSTPTACLPQVLECSLEQQAELL